uniref:ANK_REP_REGION domain-containing protein n=1 Tax=Glossina brevipalpis TaxID=37001 RepID=A0A1A9WPX0_9MUSC
MATILTEYPPMFTYAAEAGNLDDFKRLYQADNTRLSLQDSKGRTAAHQAAARNKVDILRYIHDQNGDFNIRDNAGNTPIHVAVECDSYEALDYLLSIIFLCWQLE